MQNSDDIKTEPLDMYAEADGKREKKKEGKEEKTVRYILLALKYILLAGITFLIADGAVEIWSSNISWLWKILLDLASLFIIGLIIILWKNIGLEGKISILFLYFIGVVFFFTTYFGTFQQSYRILGKETSFLSVLLLSLGTLTGIIIILIFSGMPKILKIILSLAGVYVLAGNIHVLLTENTIEQGFEGIWLWKKLPLFLRPAVWTVFFFLPLANLLLIIRITINLIKRRKVYPYILTLLPLLIITAMGLTSFYTQTSSATVSFEGLKGSLNVLSGEKGGEVISFTGQMDLYDHGVFRLNDGETDCFSPYKWRSEEKSPFPHEITFATGKGEKNEAYTVNRIVIYNGEPSDKGGIKDFELYLSMDSKRENFKKIQKFSCENSPLPQEFSFKPHEARFAKISILSNHGNPGFTELAEVEIYTEGIPIKPMKISRNLTSEEYGSSVIYYTGIEKEENTTIKNLIKSGEESTEEAWEFNQETLPQEIVFRPGEGEACLIDRIILEFPLTEKSSIKDMEILVSEKSPLAGFRTVWKTTHNQNKAKEEISFSPSLASYVKLRIISLYTNGSPSMKKCKIFQALYPGQKKEREKISPGLKGEYFSGLKFSEPMKEIVDKNLDFSWDKENPPAEITGKDYFVHWKGWLEVPSDGIYELAVASGGGYRFYLDGELIMENSGSPSTAVWNTYALNLSEGPCEIEIYHYKKEKDPGGFKLAWIPPGYSKIYFEITEKSLEKLRKKIKDERFNDLAGLKGKKLAKKEIINILKKANFNENEIEVIISCARGENDYQIIPEKFLSHNPDEQFIRTPRDAAQLGLERLTCETLEWQKKYKCYEGPLQGQVSMALSMGVKNDFTVNRKALSIINDYIEGGILGDGSLFFSGGGSVVATQFAGTALALKDKYTEGPDKTNLINLARGMVKKQTEKGSWLLETEEEEKENFMVTAGCLITIKEASLYEDSVDFADAIKRGQTWLENNKPESNGELAYRIRALAFLESNSSLPVIKEDIKEILSRQNEDGGWSEEKGEESKIFLTGHVVYALKAGGLNIKEPGYDRALNYLINNQKVAGDWPEEKVDGPEGCEFISSIWAVNALVASLEPLMINIKNPTEGVEFTSTDPDKIKIDVEVYNSTSSPLSYVEYFIDSTSIGKTTDFPWSTGWSPSSLSPGDYKLKALAVTEDERKASDEIRLSVSGPFKISIVEPQPEAVIGLESEIKVEIKNETESPVDKVDYFLNNKPVGSATEKPYGLTLNTRKIPDGNYELKAVVYKKDEEKVEASCPVKIKKAFLVEIETPQENSEVWEKSLKIKINVDNQSGYPVEKVEYYLGEKLLKTAEKPPYHIECSLKDFINGEYKLEVVAINENNDKARDEKTIYISTSLKLKIKNPGVGEIICEDRGTEVEITNNTGSRIEKVEYFIDEKSLEIIREEPYSLKISYKDLEKGKHKLKAVVYSGDGGKAFSTVEIDVREAVEVSLIATVTDKEGKCRNDIPPDSFILKEKGIIQKTLEIRPVENSIPLNMGFFIEENPDSPEKLKENLIYFTDLMKDREKINFFLFSDGKAVKYTLPGDKEKINGMNAGGEITALTEEIKKEEGIKTILIYSDKPEDHDRNITYALENNILIYMIIPGEEKEDTPAYAEKTGGKTFYVKNPEDLKKIMEDLSAILKSQYLITYKSVNYKKGGELEIVIKDNPEYKVILNLTLSH